MRLLYVLERYPELSQTFVEQEIKALRSLGAEVSVAAIKSGAGGEASADVVYMEESGLLRRATATLGVAFANSAAVTAQLTKEQSWPPPGGTRRLRGLLRMAPLVEAARRADHVHAHFATEAADIARLVATAASKPHSFTAHGADAYANESELALNVRRSSFARACSDHVRDRLVAAAPECSGRIVELGVAIDLDRFGAAPGPDPDGPVVSVGRLVEKKGFDDLIAAWATLGPVAAERELVIVGDGPLRNALDSQIAELGANVRMAGSLPNAEVAKLVRQASAFALTPRTAADGDRDGRPAAIAEAMAAGLPIVSTSQPGIPGLVTGEVGFLASPGDRDGIAGALNAMFRMSGQERGVMGQRGREIALQRHDPSRVASELIELFKAARTN